MIITRKQALDLWEKTRNSNIIITTNGAVKLTSSKDATAILRKIGNLHISLLPDYGTAEIRLTIKGKKYRWECSEDTLDESLINLANSMIE